ncbi:GNAT family N-acetyltransferase [Marinomonas sp. 15G1-11]|uniref:GNAT family N-acetyltransferase n=1 Tax=Marinomonas phaeophyticola TaxID=3004091 RepID=A0ABT4JXT9_9GAMM|nr:GNAT family N-acetyltransferase [Marinomonas sp. 15G1-11]MCZ2723205.1 GNAT family N-acetyltransferase [Marinomonas sp. 15G1-11]
MKVLTTDWSSSKAQLQFVRRQVFIIEQGIDEQDEWDELDETSVHFVSFGTTAVPTGVARLTPEGKIGRMAVLPSYRHQGYASMILAKAIQVAREMGHKTVSLHAQADAQAFYEKQHFKTNGKVFLEAGIFHVLMEREI